MARIHLTQGACPVCDMTVSRAVHMHRGLMNEVYSCPDHGRLEYGPRDVPLMALGYTPVAA